VSLLRLLEQKVMDALHVDSDHGQDGSPPDDNGGKRGICNCAHKAKVAVEAFIDFLEG